MEKNMEKNMEKIEGIKQRLNEYEQELKKNSTRELVEKLAPTIRRLRTLGASYDEIVARIKGKDRSIRLTEATLRKYLSEMKKREKEMDEQETVQSEKCEQAGGQE